MLRILKCDNENMLKNKYANLNPEIANKLCVIGADEPAGRAMISLISQDDLDLEQVLGIASKAKTITSKDAVASIKCSELGDVDFGKRDLHYVINVGNLLNNDNLGDIWSPDMRIIDISSLSVGKVGVSSVITNVNDSIIGGAKVINACHPVSIVSCNILNMIKDKLGKLGKVFIAVYESVSNYGDKAITALLSESKNSFLSSSTESQFFDDQIAFNCIPKYGEEFISSENRIAYEIKSVMRINNVHINAAIVPVFFGDSFFINIECENPSEEICEKIFTGAPGFSYLDSGYMTPGATQGEESIYIGRVHANENVLSMWVSFDGVHVSSLNAMNLLRKISQGN